MRAGGVVADHLASMEATVAELDGDLADLAGHLADGIAALGEATEWLLANGLADPRNALAGATPYLRLYGTVVGGWFHARQALASRAGAADDPFLAAKLTTARYYLEQVLPTARGLLPAVTAGPGSLAALTPGQLASH
jgi:hypothetical protein